MARRVGSSQGVTEILRIKAAVRLRDGLRCTQCGLPNEANVERTGKQLEVHRLVPGSLYSLEGCVTLCQGCHGPKPRRKRGELDLASPHIRVRIPADLGAAFEAYRTSLKPPCTASATLRHFIEEFLVSRGCWPPAKKGE